MPPALIATAAAAVLPDRLRLDRRFPGPAVAALRPHATAALGCLAALLAVPRPTRPAATGLAWVAALGAAHLVGRAVPRPRVHGGRPGRTVTVLTANVLLGRADTGALGDLIQRERPDFVVLPEAGADFADKLMPLLDGYRCWGSAPRGIGDGGCVTLLAAETAGALTVLAGGRLRFVHATGGIMGRRNLYAVHPFAPTRRRWTLRWRRDLARVGRWSREPVAPIIAGDFNASADHALFRAALGGCRDAAEGAGRGLVGTWPSSLPRWAGIQIDHVLVPRDAVVHRVAFVELPGSDHRGVLATFTLSDPESS